MKLIKALNNSALIVEENGVEKIVLGKGIGFGLKPGDTIDETRVTRVFTSNVSEKNRLLELIKEIPDQCLEAADEIISYAHSVLKKELSDSLYMSLADHIYFILDRYQHEMMNKNPFKYDIQRFYEKEYKIGKKAVELLEDEFDIVLNDDEAASIAMHLVNAEYDIGSYESMETIKLIDDILQIIRYQLKIELNENSMNYQRLLTHLKFFVQRVIKNIQYEEDNPLYQVVSENYPVAKECVERIKELLEKQYNFNVSKDECTYLIVHIQRLMNRGE